MVGSSFDQFPPTANQSSLRRERKWVLTKYEKRMNRKMDDMRFERETKPWEEQAELNGIWDKRDIGNLLELEKESQKRMKDVSPRIRGGNSEYERMLLETPPQHLARRDRKRRKKLLEEMLAKC